MFRTRARALLAVSAIACSSSTSSPDGGVGADAGVLADGGQTSDGGLRDAGGVSDAGLSTDGGGTSDGGKLLDAGLLEHTDFFGMCVSTWDAGVGDLELIALALCECSPLKASKNFDYVLFEDRDLNPFVGNPSPGATNCAHVNGLHWDLKIPAVQQAALANTIHGRGAPLRFTRAALRSLAQKGNYAWIPQGHWLRK